MARGLWIYCEGCPARISGENLYSEATLRALDKLKQSLEKDPLVDRVFSVTTVDHIAATEDGISVQPLVDVESLAERTPEEWRARARGPLRPGLKIDIGGFGRQFSDQQELLVIGQMHSFAGAFGQIFLIMLFLWRSLPAAVISMLPNVAPLSMVFILMGALGICLDMATVLIASVLLGITVDDTIHFFHQYQERREKGCGVVFSLARSFEASGRAVVAISLLLVAQFLLLAGSHFQPTAHFGLLTATSLLAGQVFELLLLPALVVLWSRLGIRKRFMGV